VVQKFKSKNSVQDDCQNREKNSRITLSEKISFSSGGRKCEVEVSGDAMKVIDISGLWRAPPTDSRDWRAGRWWEHGFVRRVELPKDTDWWKVEAYFDDGEGLLEIKVPKNDDAHQATA
jgi:hypothetical protein